MHWDVSLTGGVLRRALIGGSGDASIGGGAQLKGHVAIFPLIRLGLYSNLDFYPVNGGEGTRRTITFGITPKISIPGMPKHWRGGLYTGLGFAWSNSSAYELVYTPEPNRTVTTAAPSAAGTHWEVPLGFQMTYRMSKQWSLVFDTGVKFGFLFGNDLYNGRPAVRSDIGEVILPSRGNNVLSVFFSMGIGFDG